MAAVGESREAHQRASQLSALCPDDLCVADYLLRARADGGSLGPLRRIMGCKPPRSNGWFRRRNGLCHRPAYPARFLRNESPVEHQTDVLVAVPALCWLLSASARGAAGVGRPLAPGVENPARFSGD